MQRSTPGKWLWVHCAAYRCPHPLRRPLRTSSSAGAGRLKRHAAPIDAVLEMWRKGRDADPRKLVSTTVGFALFPVKRASAVRAPPNAARRP
jgi:hypothetical protein